MFNYRLLKDDATKFFHITYIFSKVRIRLLRKNSKLENKDIFERMKIRESEKGFYKSDWGFKKIDRIGVQTKIGKKYSVSEEFYVFFLCKS